MDALRCAASSARCDVDGTSRTRANDARDAVLEIEAIVFQSAFAPVARALGFYGDVVLAPVVRAALGDRPR